MSARSIAEYEAEIAFLTKEFARVERAAQTWCLSSSVADEIIAQDDKDLDAMWLRAKAAEAKVALLGKCLAAEPGTPAFGLGISAVVVNRLHAQLVEAERELVRLKDRDAEIRRLTEERNTLAATLKMVQMTLVRTAENLATVA